MKEICDCLEAMVKCDTVDILRVKARLSPEFEASASGGYRDVLVNLKFPQLEPPLDTYIVEVQLHLSSFLRLKKEEIGGHKTYRVARDLHIFDESVTKPLISEVEKRQLYGVSTGTVHFGLSFLRLEETQIRALRDALMESGTLVFDISFSPNTYPLTIRPHTGTNSALRELILEHVNSGTRKIGNETKTSTPMNLRSESPRKKLMDMKKKKVKKLRHRESSTIRFDDYYRTIGKPCSPRENTAKLACNVHRRKQKPVPIVIYIFLVPRNNIYIPENSIIWSILRRFQKFQARFRCTNV